MSLDFPGPARPEHGGESTAGEKAGRETRIPRMRASEDVELPLREIRGGAHECESEMVQARTRGGFPIENESIDQLLQGLGPEQFQSHSVMIDHVLGDLLKLTRRLLPVPRAKDLREC